MNLPELMTHSGKILQSLNGTKEKILEAIVEAIKSDNFYAEIAQFKDGKLWIPGFKGDFPVVVEEMVEYLRYIENLQSVIVDNFQLKQKV